MDHLIARSRGGTDRASNLVLSCRRCNQTKANRPVQEFLARDPERLGRILKQAKAPLKDVAAVNATRWALFERLQATGLPIEAGSGGRTRYNRVRLGLSKSHWADAACAGASTPERMRVRGVLVLRIAARGHGSRQMCRTNQYGFPITHRTRRKVWYGFPTGDLVRAEILRGKHAGTHIGRITVRSRPSFRLAGFDVHPKYVRLVQRADGYDYKYA